jgi:hypothetical protein
MFDGYHIVDEADIQEAGKKLARQECLLKEATAEWSAGIGQIESIQ